MDSSLSWIPSPKKIKTKEDLNPDALTQENSVNTHATRSSVRKLTSKRKGVTQSIPFTPKSTVDVKLNTSFDGIENLLGKFEGSVLGNNKKESHITRLFNSYGDRRKNEFNEFMKKDEVKFGTRLSLNKLAVVNGRLQPEQLKCIEQMGFLSLTRIAFEQLDRELVRWLVDKYNPVESRIVFDDLWAIDISEHEVSRALGIPLVGEDIELQFESTVGMEKYKNYFTITSGRINIDELGTKLETCVSSDEEFKVCYLTYVFGILLFPETTKNIRVGYLNTLVDVDKLPRMNWSKLVRDKLNEGVKSRKEDARKYLTGCSFLFQVIFFARVFPNGSTPFVNLSSPLPYVEQLTRESIGIITLEFNNVGGYWNPNACAENQSDLIDKDKDSLGIKTGEDEDIGGQLREPTPPQYYSRGMGEGSVSSYDESKEWEPEKGGERTNNEDTVKDSFPMSKVHLTLEARVGAVESTLRGICNLINANIVGHNTMHVGNTVVLNDNHLLQQIKLLEDLKNSLSNLPNTLKPMMQSVVSGFQERRPGGIGKKVEVKQHPINVSDYENLDEDFENSRVWRCNPNASHETIVQFLFDKTMSQRKYIVDYGEYHLCRGDIETLGPERLVRGSVIDVVAYMCTLNARRDMGVFACDWFFPQIMTKYMLDGKTDDATLLGYYFEGKAKFTNHIEHLQRVYLPIHDRFDHWFLAMISFNLNVVEICDTAPVNSKVEYRKKLVQSVVKRFDSLMCKWVGKDYRAKIPSMFGKKDIASFRYENMDWVPKQINGYDCGLYVCLIMIFEQGVQCIESKAESDLAREKLAVMLYGNSANKFAWK